ncbi:hypothetical protein V2A60_000938 [Cordyceps javanica]
MKTSTSLALFSLVSGISAYPALKSIYVRNCQPGHLVCQGQSQFAICNLDSTAIFMNVSKGTQCVCSGSDCTITSLDGDAPAQPSQGAPAPAPPSQAPAPSTSKAAPPAPTSAQVPAPASPQPTSQAPPPPPASQSAAPSPSNGGIFKEIPTVTLPGSDAPSATPSSGAGSGSGGIDIGAGKSYLKTFLGKGDAAAGWPQETQWASFASMWEANVKNIIPKSCTSFNQANNSPEEIADLKSAIETVSKSSGVDARFILAVVMQESNGCVRAPTTSYGVTNPGLMQSHNGANSCFNVNPCPKEKIQAMIEDGVNGTSSGDGLKQLLAKAGGNDASSFYKAARMYNSGSIDASGDLGKGIATHCYSSDIANRLVGWADGAGSCHL